MIPEEPEYRPTSYEPVTIISPTLRKYAYAPTPSIPWWEQIWKPLSAIAKTGLELYSQYLTRPPDTQGIVYQTPMIHDPELKEDWKLFTPYPRSDSGSAPSFPSIISPGGGGIAGISPMLIIGIIALFLFTKKGR